MAASEPTSWRSRLAEESRPVSQCGGGAGTRDPVTHDSRATPLGPLGCRPIDASEEARRRSGEVWRSHPSPSRGRDERRGRRRDVEGTCSFGCSPVRHSPPVKISATSVAKSAQAHDALAPRVGDRTRRGSRLVCADQMYSSRSFADEKSRVTTKFVKTLFMCCRYTTAAHGAAAGNRTRSSTVEGCSPHRHSSPCWRLAGESNPAPLGENQRSCPLDERAVSEGIGVTVPSVVTVTPIRSGQRR